MYKGVSDCTREKPNHTLGKLARIVEESYVVRFFDCKDLRQAHREKLVSFHDLIGAIAA